MLYRGVLLIFQPSCFSSDFCSSVFLSPSLKLVLLSCPETLTYQSSTQKASHLSHHVNIHPDPGRTVGESAFPVALTLVINHGACQHQSTKYLHASALFFLLPPSPTPLTQSFHLSPSPDQLHPRNSPCLTLPLLPAPYPAKSVPKKLPFGTLGSHT